MSVKPHPYRAEKCLAKGLVSMSENAGYEQLKSAFELHTSQTEQHVATVEQVFDIVGEKAQAQKCAAMEGLTR
ncbi:protein of unknown function [Dyadobacter sp. SG02]|uniref:DUF892 family protein n=1 Tax=Dyadobacter sp. SG02 TaxID=1855291 RepID=UPI0008C0E3F9|nr:DUF892 family protein [Dyadobacter sp. SG02]SEJ39399.1 protein of unknown function [Dyadobacter sp. SG02]